jgi:hypothetical protein
MNHNGSVESYYYQQQQQQQQQHQQVCDTVAKSTTLL